MSGIAGKPAIAGPAFARHKRPAVFGLILAYPKGAKVVIGLTTGAQHRVIPAPRAARAVALAGGGRQIGQQGGLWLIGGQIAPGALFCFNHEMAGAIQVYEATRLGAGVDEGDRMFKAIGVGLGRFGRGGGALHAQKIRQFGRKGLEVGTLAAARRFPA